MNRRTNYIDIDSFERAMELVERLEEISAEALGRELGIELGTTYFYLEGMADCGLVARIGLTDRYRIRKG